MKSKFAPKDRERILSIIHKDFQNNEKDLFIGDLVSATLPGVKNKIEGILISRTGHLYTRKIKLFNMKQRLYYDIFCNRSGVEIQKVRAAEVKARRAKLYYLVRRAA